jgi:hypothetical protein
VHSFISYKAASSYYLISFFLARSRQNSHQLFGFHILPLITMTPLTRRTRSLPYHKVQQTSRQCLRVPASAQRKRSTRL